MEQEFFTINWNCMTLIPKSHPRAKSLLIREKLVNGFDNGLVAKEKSLSLKHNFICKLTNFYYS